MTIPDRVLQADSEHAPRQPHLPVPSIPFGVQDFDCALLVAQLAQDLRELSVWLGMIVGLQREPLESCIGVGGGQSVLET